MDNDKLDLKNPKWVNGSHGLPEVWVKIKIPSVSAIISDMVQDPDLEDFIRKLGKEKAEQIMQAAANRGTAMHLFIENFVKTYSKTLDVSDALLYTQEETPKELVKQNIPENKINEGREMFYKFYYSDYSNKYEKLIGCESPLWSPSLFYRGKADVIYNDKIYNLSITDYKTGSDYIKKGSVKELKYKLQLGAYGNALDEMYKDKNVKVNKCSILCVSTKSEILQEIECIGTELEEFKERFKTLCREYHIKNKTEFLLNN
jgi:PD-(D/E)XK nuclease superfamily